MDKQQLIAAIESWEKERIAGAIAALKKDKALAAELLERYQPFLELINGKTLAALTDLPKKWNRLQNDVKARFIAAYPAGLPFFTTNLELNGRLRVDAWRDSHYSNQISALPQQIGLLTELTELHLQHQQLKTLPEEISQLEQLEVLDLHDNKLRELPESLLRLQKLRVLILEQNYGLKSAPDLSQFPLLEEIDFTYTDIETLPEGFFNLQHIRKITTSSCPLDNNLALIRRLIETFPDAEIVTRSRQALRMEDELGDDPYRDKESIRIDEFQLNYLPKQLFKANKVKSLDIRCYHLLELEDAFDQLQTLEKLSIDTGNDVTEFPASVFRLKNLKELHINGRFAELPDAMDGLESLERLKLELSQLKTLPPSFGKLNNLKTLETERCSCDILSAIGDLKQLETLKIERHYAPFAMAAPVDLPLLKEVHLKVNGGFSEALFYLPATITKLQLEDDQRGGARSQLSLGKLIGYFSQLAKLSVREIDLTDSSEPIPSNDTLKYLELSYVTLPVLPDSIGNLHALSELMIFSCPFETLPAALYNCTELTYFRATGTRFTSLPEGISKLQQLRAIGFERGQVTRMPEDLLALQQLEKISLEDCPLFKDKNWKALVKKKIKGVKVVKGWYD